jgi:hypothetical protein
MPRKAISRLLAANAASLADLWTTAVRQDHRIRSDDSLDHVELTDEVPNMLEELAGLLARDETPSVVSVHEGRAHVYVRFRQGYRARDLVRELSLLRLVVLDFVAAQAGGPELALGVSDYAEAARVVNLYVDEEMRYAITVYTESDES